MPEEGGGRSRQVRGELPEGAECDEPEPEGEVRGGPQEGDQEAAAAERPDQDMDRLGRHQRQDCPHREEEVHRVGECSFALGLGTLNVGTVSRYDSFEKMSTLFPRQQCVGP